MKAIGIVLAGGNNTNRCGELLANRISSALPVGGTYRAVDFALSNMSNSAIDKVAVITQYDSRSLSDHLTSAKWWDLGRKQGGLFVLTPYLSHSGSYWYRGTADALYQNMSFMKKSNDPYVVITSGDAIFKMDFRSLLATHVEKGADITVLCKDDSGLNLSEYGVMQLNEDGRLLEFEEKPLEPQFNTISLGTYIMSKTLLMSLLDEIIPEGRFDFVNDIIIRYRRRLKIYGHKFDGYWRNASKSIMEYYNTNMDFLKKEIRDELVNSRPYIHTKPKDEPPVKYNVGSRVSNSLIGSGSILNGAVENSVLFRKVFFGDNSVVKNSIIMENSFVGNNCIVEYAILDKEVILSDGKTVKGTPENPIIIKKGTVM